MSEQDNPNKGHCPRKLAKIIYFTHLILSALFTTYIIISHPLVVSPTITFVMLIIYGYMLAWVFLLNFFFMLCKKQQAAVCINRILIKLIIFVFPIFGLLSISQNHYLLVWQIHTFIIYMTVVAFVLLIYQILICCCVDKKYPSFIFATNDLNTVHHEVKGARKVFGETHNHKV